MTIPSAVCSGIDRGVCMTKKRGRIFSLLLALCLLLASCVSLPWVAPEGNGFVHSESGIRYVYAPTGYMASSIEDAPVAKTQGVLLGTVELYPVKGRSAEQFLVSSDGLLLCAEGIVLPSFEELEVASVGIYRMSDSVSIARTSKKAVIDDVLAAYRDGAWVSRNLIPSSNAGTTYELRFAADGEYEGLCYVLRYLSFEKDVLIYESIENEEGFVSSYAGVPVRVAEFTVTDEATGKAVTELCAEYNFGKTLLLDPYRGVCCMAGDALVSLLE